MSITSAGLSESDRIYKKSSNHYRKDSGELDVFEAARYFSGYNDQSSGYHCATYTQKKFNREDQKESWREGRKSLDMPLRDLLPQQSHRILENKPKNKEKKHKPPSSPGGRLASFLNSLFNQAALKKKKSKSSTQSMKDEDESPGGRRWRRSSISHFRSSSSADSRSAIYPSSTSGFRTPPPYTPTKGYKNLGSYLEDKQEVSSHIPKSYNGHVKSSILSKDVLDEKINKDLAWLDEKFRLNPGLTEKCKISNSSSRYLEKERTWGEKYTSNDKDIRKFDELDDGAESDSSSDLFELQNYDLGYYPSGLPVYETTQLENIKKGAPISNGAL